MTRRLIVRTKCWICGEQVDVVPDSLLKIEPDEHDVEYVVTHSGYKQYLHSSCWYGMIAEQKKHREENHELVY